MNETAKSAKVVINIEPAIDELFREICAKRGQTASKVGRSIIIEHLEQQGVLTPEESARLFRGGA